LKDSLVEAIGALVRPVREHFEKDAFARDLLEKILAYKKEGIDAVSSGKLRRLQINKSPDPWVIFVPIANAQIDIGAFLTIVKQLHVPPKGSEVILWLSDWSSFTLNSLGGDKKAISASFTLLVDGLRAIIPEIMNSVNVTFQSDAILTNPNDYWISVINVGRKFPLNRVLAIDETSPHVSLVVSALMHVGDVLSTSAAHIVCTPADKPLHDLAVDYYKMANITTLPVPTVHVVTPTEARLEADLYLFPLLDNTSEVSQKMKKAFCEPKNVKHCPPLVLADEVVMKFIGDVSVKRKEENGGDKVYGNIEELREDFEKGDLHPGDMKPAVTKAVEAWLGKVREEQKKEDVKKALACVKAYLKKANAEKKKK